MHKARKRVLIVDDDRNFCLSLKEHLQVSGLEVQLAYSGQECMEFCAAGMIDVVLLDQKLPDVEGADLCKPILNSNTQTKIIFTTAYPSFDNAVKAVRAGAFDYLSKPIELAALDLAIGHALRTLDLEKVEQFQNYRSERESRENVLAGGSSRIAEMHRLIDLAANADAPVLITGETGSGKNVAARSIHYRGPVKSEPFVSINCAALPESLIEAELFGHEKGAFTGAASLKKGLFEMAEGGTLFLDEIGELPVALQAKLLSVLDDGTFRRLGSTTQLRAQVRIIAATSVDLEKAIRARRFREDLFYRLSVIKVHLPPLRDRKEDLQALCDHLVSTMAKGAQVSLAAHEIEKLAQYDWPGNVRELRNVLERAMILQQGTDIRPSELLGMPDRKPQPSKQQPRERAVAPGSSKSLEDIEKEHILSALSEHNGNFSRAARAIGISLSTLKRRLKKYRIE